MFKYTNIYVCKYTFCFNVEIINAKNLNFYDSLNNKLICFLFHKFELIENSAGPF